MMQTHAYDAWLAPGERHGGFYRWSRLLGGYPAPLFLFLAGLSLALVSDAQATRAGRVDARALGRRGFEVFGYALLFRLWMFTTSGFARGSDLLRVDVLNCIGLAMVIVAWAGLAWRSRRARAAACLGLGAAIAALTPFAWDAPWPRASLGPLLGYVSGRVPGSFFPLFPWAAFAACGAAVGVLLGWAQAHAREGQAMAWVAAAGGAAIPAGLALDRLPTLGPRYDFWYTSPSYTLVKCGIVMLVLSAAYAWSLCPWASRPSPLRQLGRTSLLVYWTHVEIVYGGIVAPALRRTLDVAQASFALAILTLVMLLLSLLRTQSRAGVIPLIDRAAQAE